MTIVSIGRPPWQKLLFGGITLMILIFVLTMYSAYSQSRKATFVEPMKCSLGRQLWCQDYCVSYDETLGAMGLTIESGFYEEKVIIHDIIIAEKSSPPKMRCQSDTIPTTIEATREARILLSDCSEFPIREEHLYNKYEFDIHVVYQLGNESWNRTEAGWLYTTVEPKTTPWCLSPYQ